MMEWKLREFLISRGVKSASEARRMIEDKTKHRLSKQAMCNLVNKKPTMVRLETVAAICDTFYCRLSQFCEIVPSDTNTYQKNMATPLRRESRRQKKTVSSEPLNLPDFFPDARKFSS